MTLQDARSEFPALAAGEAETIYFDNAAGTQVPRRVLDRMVGYLTRTNANSGGAFPTSVASDATIAEARAAMADLLGAADPSEIAFGANMTALTQAFARAFGRTLAPGDEIVTTGLEHEANVSPWLALERDVGARVRFAEIRGDATIDVASLESAITDRTRLVAVGLASNAFGTINPVAEIAAIARDAGALSFVDAVHYGPHGAIDVASLGCDLLVCSAYKFFGPHVGVMWGRGELLERIPAYHLRTVANVRPDKFEVGTLNHEGIAGTLGAVEYIESLAVRGATRRERIVSAFGEIAAYERELARAALDAFERIPAVCVHGITSRDRLDERVATFAITVDDVAPRDVANRCAERSINVWSGNYYALEPMTRLGLESSGGAVRVSLVHYNTVDEVGRLETALREIAHESSRG